MHLLCNVQVEHHAPNQASPSEKAGCDGQQISIHFANIGQLGGHLTHGVADFQARTVRASGIESRIGAKQRVNCSKVEDDQTIARYWCLCAQR